jgi:hypothetical protein
MQWPADCAQCRPPAGLWRVSGFGSEVADQEHREDGASGDHEYDSHTAKHFRGELHHVEKGAVFESAGTKPSPRQRQARSPRNATVGVIYADVGWRTAKWAGLIHAHSSALSIM